MRYKITVEYDGIKFRGWQKHPEVRSVQGVIEAAIYRFSREIVKLYGSSRTDAGVHALGQVAHFDISKDRSEYIVCHGLNFYLRDEGVAVVKVEKTDDNFHCRFMAKQRHYRYRILNRGPHSTLDENRVWLVRKILDVDLMRQGIKYLIGTHDFSGFRASDCQSKSPVKTIDNIEIKCDGDNIDVYVSSRSFLYNQVRIMVGTLVEIGVANMAPEHIKFILESKDRRNAGTTAPAHGLYFLGVDY